MIAAQAEAKNITKNGCGNRCAEWKRAIRWRGELRKVLGTIAQHTGLTQVSVPISNMDKMWVSHTTQVNIESTCLAEAQY